MKELKIYLSPGYLQQDVEDEEEEEKASRTIVAKIQKKQEFNFIITLVHNRG